MVVSSHVELVAVFDLEEKPKQLVVTAGGRWWMIAQRIENGSQVVVWLRVGEPLVVLIVVVQLSGQQVCSGKKGTQTC